MNKVKHRGVYGARLAIPGVIGGIGLTHSESCAPWSADLE